MTAPETLRAPAQAGAVATKAHTPGPWYIVSYGDGDSLVICSDEVGNKRVAFMATPGCRYQDERVRVWRKIKADARLIAAAPDLLAALQYAVEHYGKPGGPWNVPSDPGGWLDRARNAVAKALGAPSMQAAREALAKEEPLP